MGQGSENKDRVAGERVLPGWAAGVPQVEAIAGQRPAGWWPREEV